MVVYQYWGGGGLEETRTGQEWGYEVGNLPEGSGGIAGNGDRKERVSKTLDLEKYVWCDKGLYVFWIWPMALIFDIRFTNRDAARQKGLSDGGDSVESVKGEKDQVS